MSLSRITKLYKIHLDTQIERYRKALAASGFDGLVIQSGRAAQKSTVDDQYWPTIATPAFTHFIPLVEPMGALVLDENHLRYLRGQSESFWEGPTPMESEEPWEHIERVELPGKTLSDEFPTGRLACLGDDVERAKTWGLADDAVNPPALVALLDQARTLKTEYEVACIAEANRRASFGHVAAQQEFAKGESSEIALLNRYLGKTCQDAHQTPYQSIVALGPSASILHHVHYRQDLANPTTALLVDAGATCLGYASDITRTHVRGTTKGAEIFRRLLGELESLQVQLVSEVKSGVEFETLHESAHHKIAGAMIRVGISKLDEKDLVESGLTRVFFPHGLGHSLGIQVHDVGCKTQKPSDRNPHLRTTVTLDAGHVMTIEPGCYFIGALLAKAKEGKWASELDWSVVDELRPFGGIRIEDNVLVTENSFVNLTRDNWSKSP